MAESIESDRKAEPFIRWPGGKRRLAAAIIETFPTEFDRYFEPFLGSGAIFFALEPSQAMLSDTNEELVNCYTMVRDHVDDVIAWLENQDQSEDNYYRVRSMRPQEDIDRAGRFLFLNRSAFNGIWRVNQSGQYNVPYGHRPRKDPVEADRLRAASTLLARAELQSLDFASVLDGVRARDLVYIDPPYVVRHENNGFRRYNEKLFSWKDQRRLASLVRSLAESGAAVVVSNAHSPSVRALYEGFAERVLIRSSQLAASADSRGLVKESLFICTSDEWPELAPELGTNHVK